MNQRFQTRCEDWPLGVEVAKMAAFAARMHRMRIMHAFIEAGASSAASIALRAELSELVSKLHEHAMQHVRARACILSRYSRVMSRILKLYTSCILYTFPAQCSATLYRSRVGRPASTYTYSIRIPMRACM